jgi:hypothetical protein
MLIVRWRLAQDDHGMKNKMDDRRIHRRCEQLLTELDITGPASVHELCALLAQRQGKPIHLIATALPTDRVCGLYVETAAFDAIFFEAGTSPLHQALIAGHEIGHKVCGHKGAPVIDAEASRLLLPNLDPALVQRFLGRSNYTAIEEREAEIFGSLLLRSMIGHADAPAGGADAQTSLIGRVGNTLEDRPWIGGRG